MDIRFEKSCPSCGAPIELNEGERVIHCSYCGVKNYMVVNKALRFVLPHKIPDLIGQEDRFYIPYFRFKGVIYSHYHQDVDHTILDTTCSGINNPDFPTSLGLRPQAMTLTVLEKSENVSGRFLKQTETTRAVFDRASAITDYFGVRSGGSLLHRAFIGETISLIYLPIYRKQGYVYDGVLNRLLFRDNPNIFSNDSHVAYQKKWAPDFLAMICPHCAGTLVGERDSLVLHCYNCDRAWVEHSGQLQAIRWQAGNLNKVKGVVQLPFWKISLCFDGDWMNTFADYLRETNQPVIVKSQHDEMQLSFVVPAFKLQPKMFLTVSKRFTMAQNRLVDGERENYGQLFPVTLSVKEAGEAIKSILVYSAVYKKKLAPNIKHINVQFIGNELIYLPFQQKGNDLVQSWCNIAIPDNTLYLGRNL